MTSLLFTFLLIMPLLVVVGPAAAADDQQVAKDVLSDRSYQTNLPGSGSPGSPGDAPSGSDKQGKQSDPATPMDPPPAGSANAPLVPPASVSTAASAATVALLRLVPAIILIAFVALVLYFGLRAFRRRRKATAPEEISVNPAILDSALITPAANVLPEWQLLADQGRFNDAIHVLLLHLLTRLRRERLLIPTASQTSREILRMENLQTTHRAGLATIIGAVEFCHFGGRPAGPQLFQHCVEAYQQVVTQPVVPQAAAASHAG